MRGASHQLAHTMRAHTRCVRTYLHIHTHTSKHTQSKRIGNADVYAEHLAGQQLQRGRIMDPTDIRTKVYSWKHARSFCHLLVLAHAYSYYGHTIYFSADFPNVPPKCRPPRP